MSEPFRFFLRVRYSECDAQGIVFNARWVEYIDVAVTEYTRVILGSVDPNVTGMDWRLVKQTCEWRAPGRYDDVLDIRVRTLRVGNTSFSIETEFRRLVDGTHLVLAGTVYVSVDAKGVKRPVPVQHRAALEYGAPGVVVDHAGAAAR